MPQKIALVPHGRKLRLVLVYQGGLANVFQVEYKTPFNQRIYQGDFRTAENICYGAGLAGAVVRTSACNMAGDIAGQCWTTDLDSQPFSDKFHPQNWN